MFKNQRIYYYEIKEAQDKSITLLEPQSFKIEEEVGQFIYFLNIIFFWRYICNPKS